MRQKTLLRVCKQLEDFWDFSHLQGRTLIICPNPTIADSISSRVNDLNISTITISSFARELLYKILGDDFTLRFKQKSQLNLLLATAWKHHFKGNYTYSLYKEAFTLFTELRSYTLDTTVLERILECYPLAMREAIMLFDRLMHELDLCDEHEGYRIIAENARSANEQCLTPKEQNIVFWGFSYLSGVQIDLINALAVRNYVEVPISEYLLSKSVSTDWVQWFDSLDIPQNIELPNVSCEIIEIGKNRLAETLCDYSSSSPVPLIVLGQKNPSLAQFLEVSLPGYSFKVPIDILAGDIEQAFNMEQLSFNEQMQTSAFILYLEQQLQTEIKKVEKNWRLIKALSLIHGIVGYWSELSTINQQITLFDGEVLLESSLLDATRNFEYHLVKEAQGKIVGLESIDAIEIEDNEQLFMCITSQYGRMNTSGSPFTREVENILGDIAPLRRYRFEFEALKEKINLLLQRPQTVVFIEKDIVKIDRGWGELLSDYKHRYKVFISNRSFSFKDDFLQKIMRNPVDIPNISASLIQNYIDCPAKFYFSRVDSFVSNFIDLGQLTPQELGELEHRVVELVMTDKGNVEEISYKLLVNFIKQEKRTIDNHFFARYLSEIKFYAQQGVDVLLEIKKTIDPSVQFLFEQGFKKVSGHIIFKGRCDCIVNGDRITGIIDFKRSAASIPSARAVNNFEKTQLPFYVTNYFSKVSTANFMGYLSLADPQNSRFWSRDKALIKELYRIIGKQNPRLKEVLVEKWDDFFINFDNFLHDKIEKLHNEKSFSPSPSSAKVCLYCPVRVLCSNPHVDTEEVKDG